MKGEKMFKGKAESYEFHVIIYIRSSETEIRNKKIKRVSSVYLPI